MSTKVYKRFWLISTSCRKIQSVINSLWSNCSSDKNIIDKNHFIHIYQNHFYNYKILCWTVNYRSYYPQYELFGWHVYFIKIEENATIIHLMINWTYKSIWLETTVTNIWKMQLDVQNIIEYKTTKNPYFSIKPMIDITYN